MSALSDVENLRLHDISDGDVRDDPRWLELMGENAVKAFLADMARKHLPGQHPQDSHGNDHGVDVIPGDKLKLAGRIQLADGEKLLSSGRIRSGQWDVLTAEIDTPNGRQVRLGVIDPSDRRSWTGGPDPMRSARLRQLDQQMDAMEKELGDVALDTDEYDRLRDERDELAGTSGDLNRTTSLTAAQVGQMRSDIEAGIVEARAMLARDERPDGGEFASGVMTGGLDGDVEWRIDEAGMSEGADDWVIWLAIRPHGEGDDWLPEGDDTASFDPKNVKALFGALADLSGDLPKSSRRDTQNKHLPGRHDQSSHGRGGRRAATAVLDVPDVPKPEPVAEPKPPKPRRAPKPKPPSDAPKPRAPRRSPAPVVEPRPPQASPEPARRSDAEINREIKEIAREMRDVESQARGPLATLARLDKKAADRGLRPADIDAYAAAEAEMQQLVSQGVFLANTHLDLLIERDGQPFGGDAPQMPTASPRTSWAAGADQDAARRARSEYVMNDKLTIASNASLRSGNPTPEARKWRARMAQMTQSQRIGNDSVVYRGAVFKPDTIMKLQPGSVLHDVGTTSTDTTRENAKFYGQRRGLKRPGLLPTLFAIKIPAGTHGYDADDDEFVFGPDSSMRILSSRRTDQGIEVTAEMLAPGQG